MRISREIKEEYALRRKRAFAQRDSRLEALYHRAPRLYELDEQKKDAIYQSGLARLRGEDEAALCARILKLNHEREALLASLGESEKVYQAVFRCSLCRDTGYENEDGKTLCACLKRRLIDENFKSANLARSDRFENFREDIYPSEKQKQLAIKLRDICLDYAEGFPKEGVKGVVLLGTTGLGKTYLLRCIAHRVLERGYSAVDITSYALMRDVMERIKNREGAADYTQTDLLIIDDLGAEPEYGNITVNTLFSILNERQNLKKPTLMATNLSTAQLREQYGERLFSRMVAPRLNALYMLKGEDLRTLPLR